MTVYKNLSLGSERALYAIKNAEVENCSFAGAEDGESALKECRNIKVKNSVFELRYPLWHLKGGLIENCKMTENCRAALWYDDGVEIKNSVLGCIKALRECDNIKLSGCNIDSREFGWFCRGVEIKGGELVSEYPFLKCGNMRVEGLNMKAKYSFQYLENAVIEDSFLDTKDAFWHSRGVTVKNSVIKGEYLAWYSEGLKLINCKIIGTQPLCYAKGLVLENCEMQDTDLSFEYSEVQAVIKGDILSIKNPAGGCIKADNIGKIILDENKFSGAACKIMCAERAV